MKPITRKQAEQIIASYPSTLEPAWRITSKKNGIGDYGRDETYVYRGSPVLMLAISFNPPKTKAFDLR